MKIDDTPFNNSNTGFSNDPSLPMPEIIPETRWHALIELGVVDATNTNIINDFIMYSVSVLLLLNRSNARNSSLGFKILGKVFNMKFWEEVPDPLIHKRSDLFGVYIRSDRKIPLSASIDITDPLSNFRVDTTNIKSPIHNPFQLPSVNQIVINILGMTDVGWIFSPEWSGTTGPNAGYYNIILLFLEVLLVLAVMYFGGTAALETMSELGIGLGSGLSIYSMLKNKQFQEIVLADLAALTDLDYNTKSVVDNIKGVVNDININVNTIQNELVITQADEIIIKRLLLISNI